MYKASIIIPTKDKITRLRLVLQALNNQINNNIEVIIIMDGCSKETINRFYKIKLFYEPRVIICKNNIGRSAARNKGIIQSFGDILIFLDDDRIPAPDFVKRHINGHIDRCLILGLRKEIRYSENEINDLFYSKVLLNNFDIIDSNSSFEYSEYKNILLPNYSNNPFRWSSFYTGNLSIKKNDLLNVGLFDEKFKGWGFEDSELGYRLFKDNIKFIKDKYIINYHITHKHNIYEKKNQFLDNYKYFRNKINNDILSKMILDLIKMEFLVCSSIKQFKEIFNMIKKQIK